MMKFLKKYDKHLGFTIAGIIIMLIIFIVLRFIGGPL